MTRIASHAVLVFGVLALALPAAAEHPHPETYHTDRATVRAQALHARPMRSEGEVFAILARKLSHEQPRQYQPDEVREMLVASPESLQLLRRPGFDPSLVSIRVTEGKTRKDGSGRDATAPAAPTAATSPQGPLQLNPTSTPEGGK